MKSKNESGMMFMDVQKITLGLPAVESPGGCICRLDNQAHRYGFFRFYHLTSWNMTHESPRSFTREKVFGLSMAILASDLQVYRPDSPINSASPSRRSTKRRKSWNGAFFKALTQWQVRCPVRLKIIIIAVIADTFLKHFYEKAIKNYTHHSHVPCLCTTHFAVCDSSFRK